MKDLLKELDQDQDSREVHGISVTDDATSTQEVAFPWWQPKWLNVDRIPSQWKQEHNNCSVVFNPYLQSRVKIERIHEGKLKGTRQYVFDHQGSPSSQTFVVHRSVSSATFSSCGKYLALTTHYLVGVVDCESGMVLSYVPFILLIDCKPMSLIKNKVSLMLVNSIQVYVSIQMEGISLYLWKIDLLWYT
jgi:hypothetical protein